MITEMKMFMVLGKWQNNCLEIANYLFLVNYTLQEKVQLKVTNLSLRSVMMCWLRSSSQTTLIIM